MPDSVTWVPCGILRDRNRQTPAALPFFVTTTVLTRHTRQAVLCQCTILKSFRMHVHSEIPSHHSKGDFRMQSPFIARDMNVNPCVVYA